MYVYKNISLSYEEKRNIIQLIDYYTHQLRYLYQSENNREFEISQLRYDIKILELKLNGFVEEIIPCNLVN